MTKSESYLDRLENVLESTGLRTFDPPLTVDYRFGSFESERGVFRCFVNEDDIIQANEYIELRSTRVYWISLEYPDFDTVFDTLRRIGRYCFKVLGRIHSATFILALEHGLPEEERAKLEAAFSAYRNTLSAGTYHVLEIWDDATVREKEKKITEAG